MATLGDGGTAIHHPDKRGIVTQRKALLFAGLVGLGLLAAGAALTVLDPNADEPDRSAPIEGPSQDRQDDLLAARSKGDPAAPITILEASDFQCPFCRVFWEETLPILDREYISAGKARLIFVNLPLPQLHANALAAHEFAMCAALQDRFWPAHDLLFKHQSAWANLPDPSGLFFAYADSAAMDRAALQECVVTGAVRELVQQEAEASFQSGIRSTPSFVIEGGLLPGAQPIEVWRPILDSIFAAKTAGQPPR